MPEPSINGLQIVRWNGSKYWKGNIKIVFKQFLSLLLLLREQRKSIQNWFLVLSVSYSLLCHKTYLFFYKPESSTHSFIIHIWFIFVKTPQSRHRFAIHQLENPFLSITPLDKLWATVFVLNKHYQIHNKIKRSLKKTVKFVILSSF